MKRHEVTDEQWEVIQPILPKPTAKTGRPPSDTKVLSEKSRRNHRLACASPGSEVEPRRARASRGRLPQDRLVEFGVRQESLEPSVLLLKVFQPLRLVHPKTTELLLPSVEGLLGDADLRDSFRDRLASPQLDFDTLELRKNLLSWFLLSAWHWLPPLVCPPDHVSGCGAVYGSRVTSRVFGVANAIPAIATGRLSRSIAPSNERDHSPCHHIWRRRARRGRVRLGRLRGAPARGRIIPPGRSRGRSRRCVERR